MDSSPDFPSYHIANAHQSALRSIARVVDECAPLQEPAEAAAAITAQLAAGNTLVLTGAGVSTDSGIPDYRGPAGTLNRHRPMTYQEFRYDAGARQRYWARSFIGWSIMNRAQPNAAHRLLAGLEQRGHVSGIITQNVDGLHVAAGSKNVIPIHGDLATVACLDCGHRIGRHEYSAALERANPGFAEAAKVRAEQVNPDGDVTLPTELVATFNQEPCPVCGSLALKPDVVYFGENVPEQRKRAAAEALDVADSLLVIGSSLAVMSGFKFVLDAQKQGKAVALINGGPTRADDRVPYRWRSKVIPALSILDAALRHGSSAAASLEAPSNGESLQ